MYLNKQLIKKCLVKYNPMLGWWVSQYVCLLSPKLKKIFGWPDMNWFWYWSLRTQKLQMYHILPLYPFWTIAFFPWLIIKSKQSWSLWNISPISGMDQWQRALDGDSHHGPLIELLPSWSLHLKRKHWTSINAWVWLIRKSVLPGKQSGTCK